MSIESDHGEGDPGLHLLLKARKGDRNAFEIAVSHHREELRRVVACRLDRSLRARVDPSDIVQEAQLEALARLPDYVVRQPMSFRAWLFHTAIQRLLKLHRHVLAARRDISREQNLAESTLASAPGLMDAGPTPSEQAMGRERTVRLNHLLQQLASADRMILELRTFQGLSYEEIGYRLAIDPAAARKRYGRALLRLRVLLLADGLTESRL
jgi:RNA polymerase sigma-70 factor, ECF subfamily